MKRQNFALQTIKPALVSRVGREPVTPSRTTGLSAQNTPAVRAPAVINRNARSAR